MLTLLTEEKTKIGGFIENTLKKEKGLKFLFPSVSIVLTNSIGRGVTAADRYWYIPAVSADFTSIVENHLWYVDWMFSNILLMRVACF